MEKEDLNWRSFTDQGSTIGNKWNAGPATYYVIDSKGTIRHKWGGNPDEKAIDAALAKLIQEAEAARPDKPAAPATAAEQ